MITFLTILVGGLAGPLIILIKQTGDIHKRLWLLENADRANTVDLDDVEDKLSILEDRLDDLDYEVDELKSQEWVSEYDMDEAIADAKYDMEVYTDDAIGNLDTELRDELSELEIER